MTFLGAQCGIDNYVGIDSSLPDNFGRSAMYGLSVLTTFITVSAVGGPTFLLAGLVFGYVFYSSKWSSLLPIALCSRLRTCQLAKYVASYIACTLS